MIDFNEFLDAQGKIYQKFRDNSEIVLEQGVKPDPFMNKAGYLILLKHGDDITEPVSRFSERIGREVPALLYRSDTLHTTFSNYAVTDLVQGQEFNVDKGLENKLLSAVGRVVNQRDSQLEITYPDWLYNQTTVIVQGEATQGFLTLAERIQSEGLNEGVVLSLPWGAHITSARFLQSRRPEEIADFFKLMQEAPALGVSRPQHLEIGYFTLSPQNFNYQTIERFTLQKAA